MLTLQAVQRDLKQYIRNHANRTIPVGYSASDDRLRRTMHRYLSCGIDNDSRADFYGLNSYEWCSTSTWETSGYQKLVDSFNESPVPSTFPLRLFIYLESLIVLSFLLGVWV